MSFLESLKSSLANIFNSSINTANKLFIVTDPAGNEIVLTLDELLTHPIPPGSSITLLVPEADVKPNAKSKLVKVGDKLVIQEGDLQLELEGMSADVSTLQILDPAAMTAESQVNIAAAINKKGFDATMYDLLSEPASPQSSVSEPINPAAFAVGGLAVAGGGGGGGGSSAPSGPAVGSTTVTAVAITSDNELAFDALNAGDVVTIQVTTSAAVSSATIGNVTITLVMDSGEVQATLTGGDGTGGNELTFHLYDSSW
jgi:hypothetical protein